MNSIICLKNKSIQLIYDLHKPSCKNIFRKKHESTHLAIILPFQCASPSLKKVCRRGVVLPHLYLGHTCTGQKHYHIQFHSETRTMLSTPPTQDAFLWRWRHYVSVWTVFFRKLFIEAQEVAIAAPHCERRATEHGQRRLEKRLQASGE